MKERDIQKLQRIILQNRWQKISFGKVAYSKSKGIDSARYVELVRGYVSDHGMIKNKECRQLLDLGDSKSAQVEASRYLKKWSGEDGFLITEGKGSQRKYLLKSS